MMNIHDLFDSTNFIRLIKSWRIRQGGAYGAYGGKKFEKGLVRKSEGKHPLGRREYRWNEFIGLWIDMRGTS